MIKQQLLQLKMKFELVHENCYLVGGRDEPSVGGVYRGKFFFWFEGMGEQVFCYWGDSLIPLVGKNLPFMAI